MSTARQPSSWVMTSKATSASHPDPQPTATSNSALVNRRIHRRPLETSPTCLCLPNRCACGIPSILFCCNSRLTHRYHKCTQPNSHQLSHIMMQAAHFSNSCQDSTRLSWLSVSQTQADSVGLVTGKARPGNNFVLGLHRVAESHQPTAVVQRLGPLPMGNMLHPQAAALVLLTTHCAMHVLPPLKP